MRNTLAGELGAESADRVMKQAGAMAGAIVYDRVLSHAKDLYSLVRELTAFLKQNKVAILRMEEADEQQLHFAFTTVEDISCPGTGASAESKGRFNEGLLTGILSSFYGRRVDVKEMDCWGKDQRICRYEAGPDLSQLPTTSASSNGTGRKAAA